MPVFPLITCEHGGNRIPPSLRPYFAGWEEILESHRGHDPGALVLARQMAEALGAPLVAATTSRLVVELNRSLGHRQLLSNALREAPKALRDEVIAKYYLPYREQVQDQVREAVDRGRTVLHISSHSFTPVLDGKERNTDIGLLYDPGRPPEVAFCDAWQAALREAAPDIKVRRNYPYTGKSDGFCTWFRRRFATEVYIGVELEVNQKFVLAGGKGWHRLRRAITASLQMAVTRQGS